MPELARWLAREARRQAARPDVLEALLAERGFAYARHRLGFPVVRTLLRSGVHAVELQLLMAAFVPWTYLAPLITYRALCAIAGAAHWGALEVMRERVREAIRQRRLGSARLEVERWLGLTLWGTAALVFATLAFETGTALSTDVITLRDAYALACVLRLGLDSSVRTLHGGVFALRRIHRPLWSTLVPDVLELAVLAFGFGALGVWSIPLATLAAGSCDAVLGYLYVRRGYLQRRLHLPSVRRALGAVRGFARRDFGIAVRHAFANLSLQLDGVVLLALVHAERSGSGSLAALFYVLRPLMAASTHWLRSFYFDLKLVETAGLRAFRPQLMRFLERLAVGWAALLAALTLCVAHLWFGAAPAIEHLLLVPFFVTRSAFALVQLSAFGRGELRRLLWLGLSVLVAMAILLAVGSSGFEFVLGTTLILAGAVAVAMRLRTPAAAVISAAPGALDLGSWLSFLSGQARVQLAVLRVNARAGSAGALVRGLRATYPGAAITRWGRRYVLFAVSEPSVLSKRALIVTSGGTLASVWVSSVDAPAVLFEQARRAGALPHGWQEAHALGRNAGGVAELARDFRARFPHGEFLELGSGRGLRARPVSAVNLRELVRCIHAHSRGRRTRSERALPFELAVFAPAGQAVALFVIDRQDAAGFDAFRTRVHHASMRASWPDIFGESELRTDRDSVQEPIADLR